MASSISSPPETTTNTSTNTGIPASLKFVVSNLRTLVPTQLNTDNYAIWRNQIVKLLRANGFEQFLESPGTNPTPQDSSQPATSVVSTALWLLTDRNLSAAICSTISPTVLPYVLNLDSTAEIWNALETRFQSSNRSKVLQLKNELNSISMKNQTMIQYLTAIKTLVDQIAAAGSTIESEDIIMYILNGLPQQYQAFKTTIRTMQSSLSLDNFYSLLISEEIHVHNDAARLSLQTDQQAALYAGRGRFKRTRGRPQPAQQNTNRESSKPISICQICNKKGHSAISCWHRLNVNYVPQQHTENQPKALAATSDTKNHNEWYLDSGASSHMTNNTENLISSASYQGSDSITIGDGSHIQIANTGSGILPTPSRKLKLANLLHIPKISYNLLSISNLVKDNDISITFNPNGFTMKDMTTDRIILRGPCKDGLYPIAESSSSSTALQATRSSSDVWHNRLGHPNQRTMRYIAIANPQLNISCSISKCVSCSSCKGHKIPFTKSCNRMKTPLALLHSDVWGPSPVMSNQGFRYYVTFIDDFSRYTWIFPIRNKSDVPHIFINFKIFIENQTDYKIKMLRTDGGTEYRNNTLNHFFESNGIQHQFSCPYTPEQNGVAERKHRHIIETTRTLLHLASVPQQFWPDAANTAVYLINRLPSSNTNNRSPYQLLYKEWPSYSFLKTFGCECFPLSHPPLRHKLQQNSRSCVFLGYSDQYKGYKCLHRQTNTIQFSRNVTFMENSFPFQTNQSHQPSDLGSSIPTPLLLPIPQVQQTTSNPLIIPQQHQNTQQATQIAPPEPSSTTCPPPRKVHPMITRKQTGSLKPRERLNLLHQQTTNCNSEPTSYTEAAKSANWRQAMATEFLALQKQGTWLLVPPPQSASILGCRWTFRTKRHKNGTIARFKARLVAQGNNQEQGIDYFETFSPVAKLPTIRILMTVALFHNWEIHQFDVENAFLHGKLSETIYMRQPKGFEDESAPNHVCLLQKAIYGLKQSPRQWYSTLTEHVISLGFTCSQADPSLLTYQHTNIQMYLLIYVDDLLITGNNKQAISAFITQLGARFNLKHLGLANHFLGISIQSNNNSYFLSQQSYAESILSQAGLSTCKPLANPTATKTPNDFPPENQLSDPALYRRITGSLQYLTLTRPDIAFAVNVISQYMHNPLPNHVYLLKRLLRYIQGTRHFGLPITKTDLQLRTYSDADWAGDPLSRKSTTGYCTFLGHTLVSWAVKKQTTVARSSTESEYRALAAATADVIWIKRLLTDFGISYDHASDLFCDNVSAIALANNPVFHARTKHIEIDHRFLRDQIQ
ncbi:Retrovirus-related Pol polyprotein from transposon TNT 1-94 [Dendrobium catenatum]|uniref:Retrovirus-related Pol polyprotein from transposon TNT 1-94 n=1 Tax=Dendrobium catenatum TaxID=906689 RepID=A0A2I0VTJ1_9ASPA|nr:Retrovirus-related Pol polyprotein from transposon TNT 1-94 [Dendrobium catenatum]